MVCYGNLQYGISFAICYFMYVLYDRNVVIGCVCYTCLHFNRSMCICRCRCMRVGIFCICMYGACIEFYWIGTDLCMHP